MKRRIIGAAGALVIAALAIGAVANGPYYAWPSWSQKIGCVVGNCPRFIELAYWNREAVLDRETGLVWEQSPAPTTQNWNSARFACTSRTTGGRKGWRLPSVHELASLIDPSVPTPGPILPVGHPFTNVQSSSFYWSATTDALSPTDAFGVVFFNGFVGSPGKSSAFFVWCVRGGMNADQY